MNLNIDLNMKPTKHAKSGLVKVLNMNMKDIIYQKMSAVESFQNYVEFQYSYIIYLIKHHESIMKPIYNPTRNVLNIE